MTRSDTLPVDGRELTYVAFARKLAHLQRAVDAAWEALGGDCPGENAWAQQLSRYHLEVANHLRARLVAVILEDYGPDLDERDLPALLDHAIRLSWLVEARVRAGLLGPVPDAAGALWDALPNEY